MRRITWPLFLLLASAPVSAQRASFEELQTFSSVLNLIRLNHVDSVSYTPLVRAAIAGALGAVDPHSRYVRREAAAALYAMRGGELASAGVELDGAREVVTVVSVGRRGPGEKAGLLAGDRIVAVQDSTVAGLPVHEVELLLSGQPRQERRVTIERGDPMAPQRLELRVRLERYTWPDVTAHVMLAGDVGYIRFGGFGTNAARELERAIDELRGRGMRRLVLDVRANPGGLLIEAVNAAALFLPRDVLVFRTAGRKADTNQEFRTAGNGAYRGLPLVMLVDGSTASAAEALAGALQDHRRARIVGHRTYGKALVQMPFPLPAGDVLWLTTARVLTPAGRMIQRSYDGLSRSQYVTAAETLQRGGADAAPAGSGGIEPEVYLDARTRLPAWWSDARARGLDLMAIQRAQLPPGPVEPQAWRQPLLAALRQVVTEELGSTPALTPDEERALLRWLTIMAVGVRNGEAEAAEYDVRTDPEIARALELLPAGG